MSGKQPALYGVLAEFTSAGALYRACESVRDSGFKKWDAHTPFPVHGLEKAMGVKPSVLPWLVLVMGLSGVAGALALQGWASAIEYPLVISGKPLFSWQAFVPICFEVGVLLAAFGCIFGMFHLNRLPRLHHPLFSSTRFEGVTDDRFFISIESADPQFNEQQTLDWLKGLGATHVELVGE